MSTDERVQRLERANRSLRWCLAGIVLCLVGLEAWRHSSYSVAQAQDKPPAVLSVKRLNIVNDEGKVVGFLSAGTLQMGAVHLSSHSFPGHEPFALLSLDTGENFLTFSPDQISMGKRTAADIRDRDRILRRIAAGDTNIPRAEHEKALMPPAAITFNVNDHGSGMFLLKNSLNNEVVSIQANKNNVGAVYVSDANGKLQQSLTGQ